jgi:outer membrane protein OmpA-like peptidoglycan-associated protein
VQDPPLVSSPAPRFAVTALLLLGCSAAAVARTVGDATRPAAASLPAPPDTEPDDDHDGVADVCDACPAVAGQVPDGCPQRVLIEECHFPTDGTVQFEADAATPTPPSAEIIEALARLIAAHPELRRVGVDGHASAGERDARRLSARRADAVLAALVARGVSASRLVARAYGVEAPVVPAAVPGAGARNRRVSLQILEADPPPQPPPPAPRRALPAGCPGSPAVPGAAAFPPLEGARSAVVIAAPFDAAARGGGVIVAAEVVHPAPLRDAHGPEDQHEVTFAFPKPSSSRSTATNSSTFGRLPRGAITFAPG